MTLVIALQLLFPLLGVGYLVSAWRHRHDVIDRAHAPHGDETTVFRPDLLVRWDDVTANDRCARSPHQATRKPRSSRPVFEQVPSGRG